MKLALKNVGKCDAVQRGVTRGRVLKLGPPPWSAAAWSIEPLSSLCIIYDRICRLQIEAPNTYDHIYQRVLDIMGDPTNPTVPNLEKKFKTELTDYSISHGDRTGPYANDLDLDALIVGAGFSELSHHNLSSQIWCGRLTLRALRRHLHAQNPSRARPQCCYLRSRQQHRWDMAVELLPGGACRLGCP